MAFNLNKKLKKQAQAISAEATPQTHEKMLEKYNKDYGNSVTDPESVQGLLSECRGEGQGEDLDVVTESQMDDPHGDSHDHRDETTEAQIDNQDSNFPHRQAGIDDVIMKPIDALAEAQDDKRRKSYNRADKKGSKRPLLDKNVGKQLSGTKTKVPSNVPSSGSQLQNHPDRFTNLASSEKNQTLLAAMRDADSILFAMHYRAKMTGRDLNEEEKRIEAQITADKKQILSQSYLQPQQGGAGFSNEVPAGPPHVGVPAPGKAPGAPPQAGAPVSGKPEFATMDQMRNMNDDFEIDMGDPNDPNGNVNSEFYPTRPTDNSVGNQNQDAADQSIIDELLNHNEDINHPNFGNVHNQERQEIGMDVPPQRTPVRPSPARGPLPF